MHSNKTNNKNKKDRSNVVIGLFIDHEIIHKMVKGSREFALLRLMLELKNSTITVKTLDSLFEVIIITLSTRRESERCFGFSVI